MFCACVTADETDEVRMRITQLVVNKANQLFNKTNTAVNEMKPSNCEIMK